MDRYVDVVSELACLNDPESYAGGSFKLLVGPPKPDRSKDRGQTRHSPPHPLTCQRSYTSKVYEAPKMLTNEEEDRLVSFSVKMSERAFGLTTDDIRVKVKAILGLRGGTTKSDDLPSTADGVSHDRIHTNKFK
ncbi:hypothetical protein ElyMa_005387400 [Elysia marginata]|uniref:Uncharacterized protein n=1 Tax=Elysia marginata TaxID=1093978 RepID=A0AAV4EET2_9GAST|nr:hypothetical protein ElyMa_005387400 [Elysia marginata]